MENDINFQSQVTDQEERRNYRTETPNILYELLETGEITPNDFILYKVYRRIAGENGRCWVGTRGLERKCKLSDKTITKSKKNLSRPFAMLNGKSLIQITPCDRKSETADIVTIVDIWPENLDFFKKRLTCSKSDDGGVVNQTTPVSESRRQKNKLIKKEPNKKIIIAPVDSPKKISPPVAKPMPAGGNNNPFPSCLDKCTDLTEGQKKQISKYDEKVLEQAIKYCYHPNTKLTGPQAIIKQIHAFCKEPERYAETMKYLDDPTRGRSLLSQRKQVALQYNQKLRIRFPVTAEKNKNLIENEGVIRIYDGVTMMQISLESSDFESDINESIRKLEFKNEQ